MRSSLLFSVVCMGCVSGSGLGIEEGEDPHQGRGAVRTLPTERALSLHGLLDEDDPTGIAFGADCAPTGGPDVRTEVFEFANESDHEAAVVFDTHWTWGPGDLHVFEVPVDVDDVDIAELRCLGADMGVDVFSTSVPMASVAPGGRVVAVLSGPVSDMIGWQMAVEPIEVEEICDDGRDNDGDGASDCDDRDCMYDRACYIGREDCSNGTDDNGDGRVDCADPMCDGTCASAQWSDDFEAGFAPEWTDAGDVAFELDGGVARSGAELSHDEESELRGDFVFVVDGFLSFSARVSTEPVYDNFEVLVDHQVMLTLNGNVGWVDYTIPVPAGEHAIRFRYRKDGSVDGNEDAVWLDDVVLDGVF